MDCMQYTTSDPAISHGAVCASAARLPVSVILDDLAVNETPERILEQYPSLKTGHISAPIAYAADLAHERIVALPAWAVGVSRRFKLDENLPCDADTSFGMAGHDVETALGERLGEAADQKVLSMARAEDRILVTLDVDLADIRECPPAEFPGIGVLRAQSQPSVSPLLQR